MAFVPVNINSCRVGRDLHIHLLYNTYIGSTSCMGSGGCSKSNSYQRRLEHSWYTSFENEYRLYYHVKKPLLEVKSSIIYARVIINV